VLWLINWLAEVCALQVFVFILRFRRLYNFCEDVSLEITTSHLRIGSGRGRSWPQRRCRWSNKPSWAHIHRRLTFLMHYSNIQRHNATGTAGTELREFQDHFSKTVLWHCWSGDRKGIWPVKKLDVGLLVVMIWLELCTTYSSCSPVVTTTSIILRFNKCWLTQVHLENGH